MVFSRTIKATTINNKLDHVLSHELRYVFYLFEIVTAIASLLSVILLILVAIRASFYSNRGNM